MRLVAEREDSNKRADVWVAGALAVSRSRAVELLKSGALRLNGSAAQPDKRIKKGDVIEGEVAVLPLSEVKAEGGMVPLVFQDAHLAVVDKPAGLAVHPGAGRPGGTLVNMLTGMGVPLAPAGGRLRPGIVHRLDMDTSGLMVVAKTDAAYWKLVKMIQKHLIHREYLAVVAGVPTPPRGTIAAALARDPRHREKYAVVSSGGRAAITNYEVEEVFRGAALVRIVLETGRTHQIRVHFTTMGWPLAGDAVYGGRLPKGAPEILKTMPRQALHSARLAFMHPVTGEEMDFTSPLPADIRALLDRVRGLEPRKDKMSGRGKRRD